MKQISKVNPFFVEIILVILFFSVSVAVTLQLFVAAHGKAQQSTELNAAVMKAQTVAESLEGVGSTEQLLRILPDSTKVSEKNDETLYRITYDKDWNETAQAPCYQVEVSLKQAPQTGGANLQAEIVVDKLSEKGKNSKKIYSLSAQRYVAK
jgi:type II secretory pathway pseudopilin PulG